MNGNQPIVPQLRQGTCRVLPSSKTPSSKSKGDPARKSSPSSKPTITMRTSPHALSAGPTGPEEQKSSRDGWLEMEAGPTPLATPVPNQSARGERGQHCMCQRRWLLVPSRLGQRGTSQGWMRHQDGLSKQPQRAKVSAGSVTCRGVQGEPLQEEPSPGAAEAEPCLSERHPPHPRAFPCSAASRSWEREEKPLGVTALPAVPGGQFPPPTPTPSALTSWFSSPMP